jgi:hypothetical protein
MYARVRSPGCSALVMAAAEAARTSGSGDAMRLSAASSVAGWPSSSTSMAEVCSLNSRLHAARPLTDFSERIFSSGSESRNGRCLRRSSR